MAYPFQKTGKMGKRGQPIGVRNPKPKVTMHNQVRAEELKRAGAPAEVITRVLRGEATESDIDAAKS